MSKYTVCGYDMDLLHARMLEIATEVDRICREQGFKCSLYGGSVIGAVRHKGFIPWDHDIDMCMPRRDYDRFVRYMRKHPNEKIFFSNYTSEPRYPNSWGKVRLNGTVFLERELASLTELHKGVFIDLHPIDNVVPGLLKLQVKLAVFWSCVGKVKSGIYTGSAGKRRIYKLFSWLPYGVINVMRGGAMKVFKWLPTKYVYKVAHPNNGIYPIPRCTFEDLMEQPFEDRTFFIPKDYDEFLTKRYGDYMQFPPESEVYECCTSIVECKL
ncbi:MAG: LicD family protein [Oscillospiraceae bacterium]|nr:LicD family protein [Oscillospiraceae bacterium]